jgi:hypothetical protein
MKRTGLAGLMPWIAGAAALLGSADFAHAKKEKLGPSYFTDAHPIPFKKSPPTPPAECKSLPQAEGKTAWLRGYEQATSGQRAERRAQIGGKWIPELLPCEEYKKLKSEKELKCCAKAFSIGLDHLEAHLNECRSNPESLGPESEECLDAYNEGLLAGQKVCDAPENSCPMLDSVSAKLIERKGCLVQGFADRLKACGKYRQSKSRHIAGTNMTAIRNEKNSFKTVTERIRQAKTPGASSAGSASVDEACEDDKQSEASALFE